MDGDRPWQSNDPSASLSTSITCSSLTPACCVVVVVVLDWDMQLKDVWCGCSLYCLLGFWFGACCPRQRRFYPRTEPHGTRRNGRVGIRAYVLYYIPEQMVATTNHQMLLFLFFAFSSVAAATWTREHLSLYPEHWTDRTSWCKAAGCRAEHSGDVTERNLTTLGFVLFFFLKKLTSETVPVHFFDGNLYFSGVFFSSVWCSDFRHCKASFIVHCMYSTTVCRNVSRLLISSVVHSDVNTHLAWWTWPHRSWFTQISEAFCGYFLILLNEIFLAMVNVFRTPHFWHIFCMIKKVFRF